MTKRAKKSIEKESIVFAVNGKRFEVATAVDPSTTLLDFLRLRTPFKSVKLGCGEGGCGACNVLISKYDPVRNQVEDLTVCSCLTLLCNINGCAVTTSEGLGNLKDGFHPIQKRFAGFNATQCGLCTPGMCMSLYGAIVNAEKTVRPKPPSGFSNITVTEAELSVAGNLCRCTGYRPIADACKSFAANVDIEDLGFNSFFNKDDTQEEKISKLPAFNRDTDIRTFPEFLKQEINNSLPLDSWYNPSSISELQNLLESSDANGVQVKLVVANTSVSYYKELEHYDAYISLAHIPELSVIKRDDSGIVIGASVTISKAIEALKEGHVDKVFSEGEMVFKKIAAQMEKMVPQFVRNLGSVGGNLVMAQRKHFPSDIATMLLAAGSLVNIITGTVRESLTLEEFLRRPPLGSKSILINIKIPNSELMKTTSPSKLLFETYRAAPVSLGNAMPYLQAAFLAEVSGPDPSGVLVLDSCRLAFGAFGTEHAIRATNVEDFLTGKQLTFAVFYEATKLVKDDIIPEDGISYPAYRSSLAVSYLFDFFSPLIQTLSNDWLSAHIKTSMLKDAKEKRDDDWMEPIKCPILPSSSEQVIQINDEYRPVGEPVTKSEAPLQCSGEVVYVDDIPSPNDCLHGTFIYSTKPFARVKGIKLNSETIPDGVSALISFRDIPAGGQNIGSDASFGPEPLFADELTRCCGERIALLVADTQKHADAASTLAVVDYDLENLEPPILTLEDAVKRSSIFVVPPANTPKQVGDISKGMDEANNILSSKIKLGSQYFFYMESQAALAVPDEDNCMLVYSSSQWPENAHAVIAKCLGIPAHNVRVITRRAGGAFGGKSAKSIPVATACALAAHKLKRPVRMYLNRKTDMKMAGGRHPMEVTYTVGFKSNGKFTALKVEILIDAGIFPDLSPVMPSKTVASLKKYDWGALSFDIKLCKTNLPSRTTMRAPGHVQGAYIADAIVEDVASYLSMDPDSVRTINLHTFDSLKLFYDASAGAPQEYTLTSIWDEVATFANFSQRIEMIKEFNKSNVWKKRGISRMPVVHELSLKPVPGKIGILGDGSILVEVGGMEMGQGLWTRAQQIAAFALRAIKCEGSENLLDKIRVVQSDTVSVIQGGVTNGSTTAESSCAAVRLACNILVDRLTPIKEKMQAQTATLTWEMLIKQAYADHVSLAAISIFVPETATMSYLNYGAAVSEVEVDLLTGETTILRSDIIYDCGQTMNPALDLGQIEGAFVQGIGFFMLEEYTTNSDGLVIQDGTWSYKIPTLTTIPKHFNVQILDTGYHQNLVLSSKAAGEPPLILAASIHCATRAAIREARNQLKSWGYPDEIPAMFHLEVPATMPVVKKHCGLDAVEAYLQWKMK